MNLLLALILLFFVSTTSFVDAKKAKVKKIYHVLPPKPLTIYDQCKIECKSKRDALSKLEQVEQLRKELANAEQLLHQAEQEANVDDASSESFPSNAQKPSRFDHLRMAASKIVESGKEFGNAVTGSISK